jgi:hypothetical protein
MSSPKIMSKEQQTKEALDESPNDDSLLDTRPQAANSADSPKKKKGQVATKSKDDTVTAHKNLVRRVRQAADPTSI